MRRLLSMSFIAAFAALTPLALSATGASAHTLGGNVYSAEQAGYSVTGGHFRYVQTTFTLPNAANFADNVGAMGFSVQVWSADRVAVLGISTCATTTCALGGTPVNEPWNAAEAVFDATTHGLVQSNGASPAMAAGDVITEKLFYDRTAGLLRFEVDDATTGDSFTSTAHVGPSEAFTQARVGAEFGVDPWSDAAYNSPLAQANLELFGNSKITSDSGHHAHIGDSWWTPHKVIMTAHGTSTGAVNVFPGSLWNSGANFTVRLHT